jgi:hypothetical protein
LSLSFLSFPAFFENDLVFDNNVDRAHLAQSAQIRLVAAVSTLAH